MKPKQKYLKKACLAGRHVLLLLFFTGSFCSCQNKHNAADMRQIMAKDEVLNQLHKVSSFDITGFKEDTVSDSIPGTNLKKTLQYTLDISYVDSNKIPQIKKGIVLFTPNGKSIINAQITDK
jgi:hypothetical protein